MLIYRRVYFKNCPKMVIFLRPIDGWSFRELLSLLRPWIRTAFWTPKR